MMVCGLDHSAFNRAWNTTGMTLVYTKVHNMNCVPVQGGQTTLVLRPSIGSGTPQASHLNSFTSAKFISMHIFSAILCVIVYVGSDHMHVYMYMHVMELHDSLTTQNWLPKNNALAFTCRVRATQPQAQTTPSVLWREVYGSTRVDFYVQMITSSYKIVVWLRSPFHSYTYCIIYIYMYIHV